MEAVLFGKKDKSIPALAMELKDLTVNYTKQETLEPLKRLKSYLLYGILGTFLMAFGFVFLALGALRALQYETNGTFDGDWSFAPYLIVLAGAACVIAASAYAIQSEKRRSEKRKAARAERQDNRAERTEHRAERRSGR